MLHPHRGYASEVNRRGMMVEEPRAASIPLSVGEFRIKSISRHGQGGWRHVVIGAGCGGD